MSPIDSPVAPALPRIGPRGEMMPNARPVSFSPAPRPRPGFSVRGTLLYPAVLAMLSLATRLVGSKTDDLR